VGGAERKFLPVLNPAHRQFESLRREAGRIGVPPDNFRLVENLAEVLTYPPFSTADVDESGITVFCDFDGVISACWEIGEKRHRANISSLLALYRLIGKIGELHLWSSRILFNQGDQQWEKFLKTLGWPTNNFPFLEKNFAERLGELCSQANPACQFSYQVGPEKITGKPYDSLGFVDQALSLLKKRKTLVVVGSSMFDRRRIRGVLERGQHYIGTIEDPMAGRTEQVFIDWSLFHYFDTGHLLL
jgi:hypothetical protein